MTLGAWLWPAVVVLVCWGIVGLLQKVSTNYLSAESAMVWNVVGFFLLLPWLVPQKSLLSYSDRSLFWAILCALFNAVGAWALLAAMKNGGKASIVVPLTALYPLIVILAEPVVLHESITLLTGCGVACALTAVILLSR
jgi:bacterial/archaeal transporter family protein